MAMGLPVAMTYQGKGRLVAGTHGLCVLVVRRALFDNLDVRPKKSYSNLLLVQEYGELKFRTLIKKMTTSI